MLALVFAALLIPAVSIARERVPQPRPTLVRSGDAVPLIQSQIQRRDSKHWLVFGKVRNQTGQTIKRVMITLEITSGKRVGQMLNAKVHPNVLTRNMDGGFQASVTSPNQQPSFKLVSVQWQYEDNTVGIYP